MNNRVRLILLSFLMLFTELALIRWTGSNVVYLSFFSNFVLLGSFLGIGLGFLRAHRPRHLFPFAPLALAGLVAFIRFFPVEIRAGGGDIIFLGGLEAHGPPRGLVLAVIFVVVASAMAFIAEGVARVFVTFPPLDAYKYDLVGSVLGIVGFTLVSFLHAPPLVWGSLVAAVFAALYLPRLGWLQVVPLVALLAILGVESFETGASWSAYYKVEARREPAFDNQTLVLVNGVPHQAHQSVDSPPPGAAIYLQARPAALDDVLVIGAGGGNDVAVALDKGAGHVDAVEIDRRLYDLGKSRHPDRPYQDPRVDVHIDDGRSFLERTDERYDLILFALPDSITLVSGQSSLRLESYLFTKEALTAARDHLKPGGAFAMYNYYLQPWLADRLANTLREVYGHAPCDDSRGEGAFRIGIFVTSLDPERVECVREWAPSLADVPAPATDDHPFPYLRSRSVPTFYLVSILLILAVSLAAVRGVGGPLRPMTRYADLFFMGAAFLLLETKNVVQFALLFGTTWLVNALVFLGVLLSVLAAVLVAQRFTFRRPGRLYAVLLVALAVAFAVSPSFLLGLSVIPRFGVAVALAFFPVFTANLVFAERFKDTADSGTAFGANLLGAMVGGVIEYLALVTGYRLLLLVVAALYGLAFVLGRSHLSADRAAGGTTVGTAP